MGKYRQDIILRYQQRRVPVAQEAEVVGQGVVVDGVPVAVDKGRDEQQQRALWLVEVGHHGSDDAVVVARGDDDLCAGVQGFYAVTVQIVADGR